MPWRSGGSDVRCERLRWVRVETLRGFHTAACPPDAVAPADRVPGGAVGPFDRRGILRALAPIRVRASRLGRLRASRLGRLRASGRRHRRSGCPDRETEVHATGSLAPARRQSAYPHRRSEGRVNRGRFRACLPSPPHGSHTGLFSEFPSASLAGISDLLGRAVRSWVSVGRWQTVSDCGYRGFMGM
jgi:hypothetical protein